MCTHKDAFESIEGVVCLACFIVKSRFFNRKSGFLNRKSGFFDRKSGFLNRKSGFLKIGNQDSSTEN